MELARLARLEIPNGWYHVKRLLARRSSSGSKSEGKRFGVVSWEERRTGRGNNGRAIAIWFARYRAGMKLEQVREQLEARSYTAVAMQVGRLKRQVPTPKFP